MSNTTRLFLIALLAATFATPQQALIKGCLAWDSQTSTCKACYRRQVSSKGCGPLLAVSDTCLIHHEQPGQKLHCTLCRPGYGLNGSYQCLPLNIFNCVYGIISLYNKQKCIVCGNGEYPTADNTICAPLPTGAIANCVDGTLLDGRRNCFRCSPGYAVGGDQASCVALTAATTGCWFLSRDGVTCKTCDALAGYSMQKNGKCKFIQKE